MNYRLCGLRHLCVATVIVLMATTVTVHAKTEETLALKQWLRTNTSRPAVGAQWNGGSRDLGWVEQERITGLRPLVYGIEYFDYGPIEQKYGDRNLSASYFKEKYAQGGIVTLVDHMPNFLTGGDSWDRSADTLSAILPGGAAHQDFKAYLDRLAVFLKSLVVNGKPVPVLIRPLHEMNGAWFWWGDNKAGDRLVKLWRFYHDYLEQEKQVDNLLWVWSPNIDGAASFSRYMMYWPGAEYVDVVGLDGYDNTATPNLTNRTFVSSFRAVADIATSVGLPVVLTEIGAKPGAQEVTDFWDVGFKAALDSTYRGISYVLIWNGAWGPKAGTPAASGFRNLIQGGSLLRLRDVAGSTIYGPGFSQ